MFPIDIFGLLKEGAIDGIRIGATPGEVLRRFSLVQRDEDLALDPSVALFSGWGLELHFIDGHLRNLVIKMPELGRGRYLTISQSKYKVTSRTTFNSFVRQLHTSGIEWEFFQRYCSGRQLTIKTEGGATVEFVIPTTRLIINRIHLAGE